MGASHKPAGPISQSQLTDSLTNGRHWIAIEGSIYDVSSWCESHPGGKLVLLHSRGRDVSEAFNAYHPLWVKQRLAAFKVGQLESDQPDSCVAVTGEQQTPSTQYAPATQHAAHDRILSASLPPQLHVPRLAASGIYAIKLLSCLLQLMQFPLSICLKHLCYVHLNVPELFMYDA